MSGMTSQPCLNSVVAALKQTKRETGVSLENLDRLSDYWADVRENYYPFEENLKSPSSQVYQHEMPGGQFTNLDSRPPASVCATDGREVLPRLCGGQPDCLVTS